MRILYVVGLVAEIVFTLAASTWPSAAMVIYPWCANYGGRMSGAQNCGFTSRQQCELTRAGNGGFCIQNPWYQLTLRPYGGDVVCQPTGSAGPAPGRTNRVARSR
jgi:Protein of unknown function (DUF3551)